MCEIQMLYVIILVALIGGLLDSNKINVKIQKQETEIAWLRCLHTQDKTDHTKLCAPLLNTVNTNMTERGDWSTIYKKKSI